MNRRQFLSLIPAAAVAGTVSAATAAAPKSLSLEEGLASAWRVAEPLFFMHRLPVQPEVIVQHPTMRVLTFVSCGGEVGHHWAIEQKDLCEVDVALLFPSPLSRSGWWLQTEQGPMRLCPHSLRWLPYSPKTAAI